MNSGAYSFPRVGMRGSVCVRRKEEDGAEDDPGEEKAGLVTVPILVQPEASGTT